MTPSLLVLLSVGLGIIVGVLIVGSIVGSRAIARSRSATMHPEVPVAATTVLDAELGFGVILDAALSPVYANRTAREHETITGELLRTPEFLSRAREVLATGLTFTHEPEDDSIWLRVLRLGDRFLVVLAEDRGEEQRVNAMRRDFITNISHELKTPISAIGLLSEAVHEAADDPVMVRSFSKKLMKESRRLGELARDVIRLSEAQATLLPEQRERVDLRSLVRHEVDQHRILAGEQRVDLVVTEDSDGEGIVLEPALMLGRPSALAVAVANLLSNAIEHSPPGARVGIGMQVDGAVFVVTVTDQGPGIAAEYLPRVFERFFRVDDGRSRDEGGTGLGLSIVRHTLRSHGGDVDVWSQPGVGSSFSLTFPLEGGRDEAKAKVKREKRTRKAAKSAKNAVRMLQEARPAEPTQMTVPPAITTNVNGSDS